MLTITDDYSRYTWLYFLKTKAETLSRFKQFRTMMETQSGYKLKAIRSNRGGEYLSNEFQAFCEELEYYDSTLKATLLIRMG